MEKIYVRFGKIFDKDRTEVYEAILNDNKVTILMPKHTHPAFVDLASTLGESAYVVEGTYIGTDDKSRSLLSNVKIVHELIFDQESETYMWSVNVPSEEKSLYDQAGFWEYFRGCIKSSF